MDYNVQRPYLKQPEYGRNIQQMIDYCCTIETKEERTKAAYTIIDVMGIINPGLRDNDDYNHKLWDNLAIMSDFRLDIDWPFELPDKEVLSSKPEKLNYSENHIKYRHYGKITQNILNKINEIDEIEERNVLIELMANFMKRLHTQAKQEQIPNELIYKEFKVLTDNSVEIPENLQLKDYKHILNQPVIQNTSNQGKRRRNKNKQRNKQY